MSARKSETPGRLPTGPGTAPASLVMRPFYRFCWLGSRALFRWYFGWRVFHPERVPREGAVILAANHASVADPPLIGSGLAREVNYLGRDTLFNVPLLRFCMHRLPVVPVKRDGGGGAGLKAILDRLIDGGAILLFPEGTRTPDGRLGSARSGIGLMVIKSAAPVVPIRVFGTFEAFGRRHWFPRPRRVMVKYGHPMRFEALRAEAATCSKDRLKQIYQQVAEEIMAAIAKLEPAVDREQGKMQNEE